MTKYLILGFALIIGISVYYTGLYIYFIRTDIQENLPQPTETDESAQEIISGEFITVDLIHKGSGQARLIRVDGKNILRFENFNVTNGPDLYVYLSKSASPTGDLASLEDYIDLGPLKGDSGNQNYEINGEVAGYRTAIIWCKRFGVLFTYAVME